MQQHGQHWLEDNPEQAALPTTTPTHHVVWIPPVLVNYEDGVDLAAPLPKRVRL